MDKNHEEQANYVNAQSHEIILVNLFSEMQKLVYEIINVILKIQATQQRKVPCVL